MNSNTSKENTENQISYEDKILLERALEDFRAGRTSSRKKIFCG